MKTVNVHEAKTNLSQLLSDVERGEEVVIARNGNPVARLTAVSPPKPRREPGILRKHDAWKGFVYDPGLFAPMTDEEMAEEGWV